MNDDPREVDWTSKKIQALELKITELRKALDWLQKSGAEAQQILEAVDSEQADRIRRLEEKVKSQQAGFEDYIRSLERRLTTVEKSYAAQQKPEYGGDDPEYSPPVGGYNDNLEIEMNYPGGVVSQSRDTDEAKMFSAGSRGPTARLVPKVILELAERRIREYIVARAILRESEIEGIVEALWGPQGKTK